MGREGEKKREGKITQKDQYCNIVLKNEWILKKKKIFWASKNKTKSLRKKLRLSSDYSIAMLYARRNGMIL